MDEAERLYRRMLRIVGIGQLHLVQDTGVQQTAQVSIGVGGPALLQEVQDDVPRLGEYGHASCPPDGSEAIILYLGGQRSMGVIVATGNRATRLAGLLAGESALYNGLTGRWLKMDAAGKAHMNGDGLFDGTLEAAALVAGNGASGTFTTPMGQTVTVQDGIIVNIA